jgi:hypothetical protein
MIIALVSHIFKVEFGQILKTKNTRQNSSLALVKALEDCKDSAETYHMLSKDSAKTQQRLSKDLANTQQRLSKDFACHFLKFRLYVFSARV